MHFLKKGQKLRAWVDPPPLIRAMPERKRFFSLKSSLMLKYQTLIIYKLLAKKGWEAGGYDLWLYQGPTLALTPCRGLASGAHC